MEKSWERDQQQLNTVKRPSFTNEELSHSSRHNSRTQSIKDFTSAFLDSD